MFAICIIRQAVRWYHRKLNAFFMFFFKGIPSCLSVIHFKRQYLLSSCVLNHIIIFHCFHFYHDFIAMLCWSTILIHRTPFFWSIFFLYSCVLTFPLNAVLLSSPSESLPPCERVCVLSYYHILVFTTISHQLQYAQCLCCCPHSKDEWCRLSQW